LLKHILKPRFARPADMPTPDKTIDHSTLCRLIDAGADVGAEVVGGADGWGVVISYGRASQTLAATRGAPRTWRQFETLASYLKELGIVEYRVNTAEFAPGAAASKQADKRSSAASERMKRAHQAAAHDTWFREQVQASIDDPRASVDHDVAMKEFAAKRAALANGVGTAKKAAH
jgi:coenzyme F420-reducing hydrogenase delta subunit